MIQTADSADARDPIRRRIEALGSRLSLPTVIRALGSLEGEHASSRRGNGYDFMDIRPYEPGEEARLIDWKASARAGRPMIVNKEQESNGNIWLLMDVGREMCGRCPNGERPIDVAANAMRMFAMLSLRRSDDLSMVLGDNSSITRIPFSGGFAKFEHVFDALLERDMNHPRDFGALIDYARKIRNRHAMVVLATDETAWTDEHIGDLRLLAQTHPLIVINVAVLNPFAANQHFSSVVNAANGLRVPAFLRTPQTAEGVETHRRYAADALERQLASTGSTQIHGGSSEAMFNEFVTLVSGALAHSGFAQHAGRNLNTPNMLGGLS